MPKLLGAKVRNGAPRSVAKGCRGMTNEATLAILLKKLTNNVTGGFLQTSYWTLYSREL